VHESKKSVSDVPALYAMLEDAPFTIKKKAGSRIAQTVRPPGIALKLVPVGVVREPATEVEALRCMFCLLSAVYYIHEHGWAHADIRAPNIIQTREDSEWHLIDFDNAIAEASVEQKKGDIDAIVKLFQSFDKVKDLESVKAALNAAKSDVKAAISLCKQDTGG
jgi:serine/threonine protein kinase